MGLLSRRDEIQGEQCDHDRVYSDGDTHLEMQKLLPDGKHQGNEGKLARSRNNQCDSSCSLTECTVDEEETHQPDKAAPSS